MNYSQHYFKTDMTTNEENTYEMQNEAIRDAMRSVAKSEEEIALVIGNPRLRAAKLLAGRAAEKYGKPKEEVKGRSTKTQYL